MPENSKFNHLIKYSEAGSYLNNIKDKELLNIFKIHIGGTINASHFQGWLQDNSFSGIMIWFCLDEFGDFYLAFEGKSDFSYPENDSDEIEKITPASAELIRSTMIFGRDLSNESNRESFIRSHKTSVPTNEIKVSKADVEVASKKFLSHQIYRQYQKYGFSYFGNTEEHVSFFLKQSGLEHVRYYLGFDPSVKVNNLRIILAPVGMDGKNLEFESVEKEYQLLQRSVPPPPNN